MKKHIIGLLIFTLIVGTSVVIAGLFGYSSSAKTYKCKKYQTKHKVYKKKKRKKRCRKKKKRRHIEEFVSASVTQAVFDKKTGTLTANVGSSKHVNAKEIDLHFFTKDEFGTQYLKKETISVSDAQSVYENSFAWLNRLESRRNLYVMAEARLNNRNFDYQPRFNASEATPVLLQSTK